MANGHPTNLPVGRFSVRLKLEPIWVGSLFLLVVDLKSTKKCFILDGSKCCVNYRDRNESPNSHIDNIIPYLLHFGNIQERHLWKKNPKFTF